MPGSRRPVLSDQAQACPECARRADAAGLPCDWCRAGLPLPDCPTCRESGPEGQTLMFATMEVTEATCSDCRDWISAMEALELGYPKQPRRR